MTIEKTRIVVLGAGYAGLMATIRVAGKTKKLGATVSLINGLDTFVERPRLPEMAGGKPLKTRSIQQMLRGTGAQFMQGWVQGIDAAQQTVQVKMAAEIKSIPYDYLIIALGSHVNRTTIPGVDDHAYSPDPYGKFASTALQARLAALGKQDTQVVVIGGGATGIEMATEIKGAYPHIHVSLFTKGDVGTFKGPRLQPRFKQALQKQAITVRENCNVTRVTENMVWLGEEPVAADCIVWAGGFQASSIASEAGLPVNQINQVKVDPYLRTLSYTNIYAVGDLAFPVEDCGTPVRMALFPALVMGATAADNIVQELKSQSLKPLGFVWYGQAITLGPKDAVGFNTYPVDQVTGPIFRGQLALRIRNFFVWMLGTMLELERRWPGAFYWNGKQRYLKTKKGARLAHD